MKYINALDESGKKLLADVLKSGEHQPTEQLILAIKSLQLRITSSGQDWIIDKKGKRGGKLDLEKFKKKFFSEI